MMTLSVVCAFVIADCTWTPPPTHPPTHLSTQCHRCRHFENLAAFPPTTAAGTTVFAGPQPAEVAVPGLVDLIAAGREAWPAPASGEQPAPTNGAQQAEQRELSLA